MNKLSDVQWIIEKEAEAFYVYCNESIGAGNLVELYFGTKKSAIAFCERNGFKYRIVGEGV